jgi:hypothetical protein
MMNTEVVHDGVYKLFLEELEVLGKGWYLPMWAMDHLGIFFFTTGLLTVASSVFVSTFVWVPAMIMEVIFFTVCAFYSWRLNYRYRFVSWKYLRKLIPDAYRAFPLESMDIYRKTMLQIDTDDVTYCCDLRILAESNGRLGWQVVNKRERLLSGSFADMQAWVNSRSVQS